MRFPHCDVYKSWKILWKTIQFKEWEPCVCMTHPPLPALPEQHLSVLILCTNQKQLPVGHISFQHKCYYLNTSCLVSGLMLVLMALFCFVFNADLAGSSVQSISAAELLKQQKALHQQRFQARQKRAEEIQKRCVLVCI